MDNLELYNAVRKVPQEAQKKIEGGRIKGFTDINPMWRIKMLTERFGPCGIGWYYDIKEHQIDTSMGSDEISASVIINLYIKVGGEWSKPIQGIGGSMFVVNERNGLRVNDECYKMALTDAISVACKALGMGADVYWQNDRTKYDTKPTAPAASSAKKKKEKETEDFQPQPLTKAQQQYVRAKMKALQITTEEAMGKICGATSMKEMNSASLAKFVAYVNKKEESIRAAQAEYGQAPEDLGL